MLDFNTKPLKYQFILAKIENLILTADKDQKLEECEYERVWPECFPDFEIDK